jgi:Arc/MetJ family transcription regulator
MVYYRDINALCEGRLATMSRTLIDTNDEALSRAAQLLGTRTKKDTVNAALAEVIALKARREFLDDSRAGALADADDESVTDRAWRQ